MSNTMNLSMDEEIELIRQQLEDDYRLEGGFQVAHQNFSHQAWDTWHRRQAMKVKNETVQDAADAREDYLCRFE